MKTLSDIIHYFSEIQQAHKGLKAFVYGDSEKIGEGLANAPDFPLLWLETPELSTSGDFRDTGQLMLNVAFELLAQCDKDHFEEEQHHLDELLRIVFDIIARLNEDTDRLNFQILGNVRFTPFADNYGVHCVGWSIEFTMNSVEFSRCREDVWDENYEIGVPAQFEWENIASSGGIELEITNSSSFDGSWDLNWKLIMDGETVYEGASLPDPITPYDARIGLVQLQATQGDKVKHAHALVSNLGAKSGSSLPFFLHWDHIKS